MLQPKRETAPKKAMWHDAEFHAQAFKWNSANPCHRFFKVFRWRHLSELIKLIFTELQLLRQLKHHIERIFFVIE